MAKKKKEDKAAAAEKEDEVFITKWRHWQHEKGGLEEAWAALVDKVHQSVTELSPIEKAGIQWAFIHRPETKQRTLTKLVGKPTTVDEVSKLINEVMDKTQVSFLVRWFNYHQYKIGICFTVTSGDNAGEQFLLAPNDFEEQFHTQIYALRAIDMASRNS